MKDYSKIIRNKARFYGVPAQTLPSIFIVFLFTYIIKVIFDFDIIFILFFSVFLSLLIIQAYEFKFLKSETVIEILSQSIGELPIRLQTDIENLDNKQLNSLISNIMKVKSLEQLNIILNKLKS